MAILVVKPSNLDDVSNPDWIRGGTLSLVIDDHAMA